MKKISIESSDPETLVSSRRRSIVISSSCILNSTDTRPLATTTNGSLGSSSSLFLVIQHQAQDIETKLGELETHATELLLSLVTQNMRPRSPKRSHGFADTLIFSLCVTVDVASVFNLTTSGTLGEVNFLVGEGG
jgi:hypothetical protein